MSEMHVLAIGIDARRAQPMVLLQEDSGQARVLPIWIGQAEAEALERARRHITASRPDTHALLLSIVTTCGRRLQEVTIAELRDSVFHAELVLDDRTRISARPSDALTLALQARVPIRAGEAVLERAALPPGVAAVEFGGPTAAGDPGSGDPGPGDPGPGGEDATEPDEADQMERFRRFLDTATPEDFDPDRGD